MSVKHDQDVPLLSANKISLYSGLDRRTCERRLLNITPAKENKRERLYRIQDILPALIQAPEIADAEARILALREREQQSKTEAAELAQLEREKKTCLLSTATLFVSESRIAIRQCVEHAPFLTPVQKTKLLARFAEIRIEPPKAEPVN